MYPEVTSADYHGPHTWDSVQRALPSAVAAVREVMGFNVPEGAAQEAAYKSAIYAAMDVDAAYGFSGGVAEVGSSLRLGSFSVSQGSGQSPYATDMDRAIRRALSGSGLLYQGLG
jgi:hypothetical protein